MEGEAGTAASGDDRVEKWRETLELARRLGISKAETIELAAARFGQGPAAAPTAGELREILDLSHDQAGLLLRLAFAEKQDPPSADTPTQIAPSRAEGDSSPQTFGPYRLLGELGRGGMGVVYRAFDPRLRREVALKVLPSARFAGEDIIERFRREARAAAGLVHPNIVQIHDVGLVEGRPYYTMELLPGSGLDRALVDRALTMRESVEVVRQVAGALQFAHERGVLHRDVKPRNILVQRHEGACVAKLVDFGLAKLSRDEATRVAGDSSAATLTQSGQVLGTPAYMSPEQVRGAREVDARADVYSIGATLYEALTGLPPILRANVSELLEAIFKDDPIPPRRLNDEVDADLETICLKCLQKDAADRYGTAGEVAEDCRRWLVGEPIVARPLGFLPRWWRKAKRHRGVALPVGGAALVLVALVVAIVGMALRDRLRFNDEVALARQESALGRHVSARRHAEAAHEVFPDEPEGKKVLAEVLCAQGRAALSDYDREQRGLEELELAAEAALPTEASAEAIESDRQARWARERDMVHRRRGRGEAWSRAVALFHQALVHVLDHPEARSALAGLYWDELLAAERRRDPAEASRYRTLVEEYGDDELKGRLKGERDVQVRFHLPAGLTAREVSAHLFVYLPCVDPPILVPVPCDPRSGDALGPPRAGAWRPVPLASALAAVNEASALSQTELDSLSRQVMKLLTSDRHAEAIPLLDVLTRAAPTNPVYPMRLAESLAVCAREGDPHARLRSAAGEVAAADLKGRWAASGDRMRSLADAAFRDGGTPVAWDEVICVAVREAVRRGWTDEAVFEAGQPLDGWRSPADRAVLLAVLHGQVPRQYARVAGVDAGSQAERLALRTGDAVLSVDGHPTPRSAEVTAAVRGTPTGRSYELVLHGSKGEVRVTATGGEKLGIQVESADLSLEAQGLMPWTGEASTSDAATGPLAEVRRGTAFPLSCQEANRVRIGIVPGKPPTADLRARLPRGSYVLYVPAGQGLYEARYPIEVSRDVAWDEACDLAAEDGGPPLPPGAPVSSGAPYWVQVPAGPYESSGDPESSQSPPRPRSRPRVPESGREALFMGRFEVTFAMYLEYVNDLAWHGNDPARAWDRVPRKDDKIIDPARTYVVREESGRVRLRDPGYREWPVFGVTWDDAENYGTWLTARIGGGRWRLELPTEDEWEKAARGPAGRYFPWGDEVDPSFGCAERSRAPETARLLPEPFGLFPVDESPYGVRDMGGLISEWMADRVYAHGDWRVLKGGSWASPQLNVRSASRYYVGPRSLSDCHGFRLTAHAVR